MKVENNRPIKNWSHTFKSKPEKVFYPTSINDVCELVRLANEQNKTIRVIGAGHSFTPLVNTDDWLLSLDDLSGIEAMDDESQTVTVLGGTRLFQLGEELGKLGYAQENLGDINVQSISGAISTGTHGTGMDFGNLSTQVVELTVVTATGELLTLSEKQNSTYFKAALVALGMLGIIVKVKLKVIQAPIYEYQSDKQDFSKLIDMLDDYIHHNKHFEFYMFPYSDLVQTKTMNLSSKTPTSLSFHKFKNLILENYLFFLLSTICKWIPRTSKIVSRLSAKGIGKAAIVAPSYQLFATPRLVRFREMEYCIPLPYLKDVLAEIRETIHTNQYQVHFPIECRVVKGDDIWLSPSYQRDSAYIAFHMYKGMPYEDYFHDMEQIMMKYEGRPHWGKMHTRGYEEMPSLYPKWSEFLAIRKELDPKGTFMNSYLKEIFDPIIEEMVEPAQM